jgi:metal-dependent hydrolase
MDMLFARQPIFNTENKIVAYELLYRNEVKDDTSTDIEKTMDVITNVNTFFSNFDTEVASKRMFLNFDKNLLMDNIVDILSPLEHVIEILETVEQDKNIINRIIQLKRRGYKIAIDDYTINYPHEDFVDLADYIKVDFIANSVQDIITLSKREKFRKKILLAEKVENETMHNLALKLNYKLFQGYYYAKPIVHKGNYISINVKTCLSIIRQLNTPDVTETGEKFVDLYKISRSIEKDPVLTFKILQIANSVRANLYVKIDSILRAVTLLGYKKLNKWLKILLFQEVKTRGKGRENLNKEVIKTIVIRTSFVENIVAENPNLKDLLGEMVLASMIDLFDILFDMTVEEIVKSLDLSGNISDALLNEKGIVYIILLVLRSYERADWDKLEECCNLIGVDRTRIAAIYQKSWEDSKDILDEMEKESSII